MTFAGGLAAGGMRPVCGLHSTFLHRGYDQIIHDAALQNVKSPLPSTALAVGEDGETSGILTRPFLNTIPQLTVFLPAYMTSCGKTFKRRCTIAKGWLRSVTIGEGSFPPVRLSTEWEGVLTSMGTKALVPCW